MITVNKTLKGRDHAEDLGVDGKISEWQGNQVPRHEGIIIA
jgi:hypothetical protein